MQRRKALLTGAGFSHNFGLPLASGVWNLLFNNQAIQSSSNLKEILLDEDKHNFNYENVNTIIKEHSSLSEEERNTFLYRVNFVFEVIFETATVNAFSAGNINSVYLNELQEFIKLFSSDANEENNFIFTLNQDLFLERLFLIRDDKIESPYMGNCIFNYYNISNSPNVCELTIKDLRKNQNFKNGDGLLPSNQLELEQKIKDRGLEKGNLPYYVKLHGSIGWWRKNDLEKKSHLIVGGDKFDQVKIEPILNEFFQIFKKYLKVENTDILIIGYSFSDKHVNKVLFDAIRDFGLKMHVIDVLSIDSFLKRLKMTLKNEPEIFAGFVSSLSGYYQGFLKDFFPATSDNHESGPGIFSKTILWQQLKSNFFEENIPL